ncbi:hypothetical protein PV325_002113 [Microctonus aethiopoides]|nr:hypothetical protein PV325_002113 [Microctonus aethiopoides]
MRREINFRMDNADVYWRSLDELRSSLIYQHYSRLCQIIKPKRHQFKRNKNHQEYNQQQQQDKHEQKCKSARAVVAIGGGRVVANTAMRR